MHFSIDLNKILHEITNENGDDIFDLNLDPRKVEELFVTGELKFKIEEGNLQNWLYFDIDEADLNKCQIEDEIELEE